MRLLPFLILPAALGLGFVLGKISTPPSEPPALVAAPAAMPAEPRLGHYTGSMAELLDQAESVGTGMIDYPLIRGMEDASPAQLTQWAAELITLHDRYAWWNAVHELLNRWAETDVPAAVAWVKNLPAQDKASAMHQLLSSVASHDPKQAQALAASMGSTSERTAAISSICEGLATTDPKGAFDLLLLSQGGGDQRWLGIHVIFENWGRTDPAAALVAFARLTSDAERVSAVAACFGSWGRHDPAGAMAAAVKLPNQQEQKEATKCAFSTWFNTDQGSALTWLEALPPAERSELAREDVWKPLAANDPARATALVSGLSGYARADAFKGIAAQLARQNVDGALSWALSLPSLEDQRAALSDLGPQVAWAGAEKLLWLAERLPEGMGRFDYLQKALLAAGKDRPEVIKSVLAGITEDEADKLMRNTDLVTFLSRIDPKAAETWMGELPPSTLRAWAVRTAGEMAEKDPQAALNWASQLPADQQQNAIASILPKLAELDGPAAYQQALLIQAANPKSDALEKVLYAWMGKDPAGPEKILPELTGKARKFVLYRIASEKIRNDPETGITHLLTLVKSGEKEETQAAEDAVGGLAFQAVSDPGSATAWLHRLPAGAMQETFLQGMANDWLQQNPTACLEWMNQLPEGVTRDLGLHITAQEWIDRDLEAATEWITTLPEGNVKDQAARHIVDRQLSDHPEQAATWAQRIHGAESREEALRYVYSNWLLRDPSAATKTLEKLPPAFREKLRHQLSEMPDPFAQ